MTILCELINNSWKYSGRNYYEGKYIIVLIALNKHEILPRKISGLHHPGWSKMSSIFSYNSLLFLVFIWKTLTRVSYIISQFPGIDLCNLMLTITFIKAHTNKDLTIKFWWKVCEISRFWLRWNAYPRVWHINMIFLKLLKT